MRYVFCALFFVVFLCDSVRAEEAYESLIGYIYRNSNPQLAKEYHATAITQWEFDKPKEAIERYKMACNLGLGISCAMLGDIYKDGLKNTPQDLEKAKTFYALACALGDTDSCDISIR